MVGTRQRTAAAQSGLLLAVAQNHLAAVQRELAQPSAQWVAAEGGLSALHLAAGFASPAVLEALLAAPSLPPGLLNAGLQANYTDPSVLHPLLESATMQQRLALRKGATALHMAVYIGNADAVRLLLAAKACPN
ncbi:Ankyrin repeat-containing domain [Chlorella sorokiniana]|uniref:Ankyrin repeat-containing domain n=1 Tax=Chlorella sorokiniana TaxID=3076 RepID=A0A2P6TTJ7_CHLSO|nr:Ankyrin repeat-containing domain [Chlorella sorokiniana]|eukprot:PRW57373.1 Ankyrin repeat-containing domain [Chlorella sorokiniana]